MSAMAPGAPEGLAIAALDLLPRAPQPDWAAAFPAHWTPGEDGAAARCDAFLRDGLDAYAASRDRPGLDHGTSGLSPHLHWGEISPRLLWHAASAAPLQG